MNPPIPWGPRRLLCPVKAIALAFTEFMLSSRTPAPCDESTIKNTFFSLQILPTSAIFWIDPVTFEAWVNTTNFVSDVILDLKSETLINPDSSASIISRFIFNSSLQFIRGRKTELCSIEDVITWSPCLISPFINIFNEVVTLFVKITLLGDEKPKKSLTISRASYKNRLLWRVFV